MDVILISQKVLASCVLLFLYFYKPQCYTQDFLIWDIILNHVYSTSCNIIIFKMSNIFVFPYFIFHDRKITTRADVHVKTIECT